MSNYYLVWSKLKIIFKRVSLLLSCNTNVYLQWVKLSFNNKKNDQDRFNFQAYLNLTVYNFKLLHRFIVNYIDSFSSNAIQESACNKSFKVENDKNLKI